MQLGLYLICYTGKRKNNIQTFFTWCRGSPLMSRQIWFQMFYSDAAASSLCILPSKIVLFSSLQRTAAACGGKDYSTMHIWPRNITLTAVLSDVVYSYFFFYNFYNSYLCVSIAMELLGESNIGCGFYFLFARHWTAVFLWFWFWLISAVFLLQWKMRDGVHLHRKYQKICMV